MVAVLQPSTCSTPEPNVSHSKHYAGPPKPLKPTPQYEDSMLARNQALIQSISRSLSNRSSLLPVSRAETSRLVHKSALKWCAMFHLEVRPVRVGQEAFADLGAYLRHARLVKVWDTELCADWQLGTKCEAILSAPRILRDRVSR